MGVSPFQFPGGFQSMAKWHLCSELLTAIAHNKAFGGSDQIWGALTNGCSWQFCHVTQREQQPWTIIWAEDVQLFTRGFHAPLTASAAIDYLFSSLLHDVACNRPLQQDLLTARGFPPGVIQQVEAALDANVISASSIVEAKAVNDALIAVHAREFVQEALQGFNKP